MSSSWNIGIVIQQKRKEQLALVHNQSKTFMVHLRFVKKKRKKKKPVHSFPSLSSAAGNHGQIRDKKNLLRGDALFFWSGVGSGVRVANLCWITAACLAVLPTCSLLWPWVCFLKCQKSQQKSLSLKKNQMRKRKVFSKWKFQNELSYNHDKSTIL